MTVFKMGFKTGFNLNFDGILMETDNKIVWVTQAFYIHHGSLLNS
jgi:hypothetical protein